MSGLEPIAIGLTAASAVIGAGASIYSGVEAKKAAQREAHQLEGQGREAFAANQRDALEARLQGKLLESRQQAVAAASGGGSGVDAPSIVKLMTETGERSDYAAEVAMYSGIQQKKNAYEAATVTRRGGQASLLGSILSATGTLAGGLGRSFGMAAT